MIAYLHYADNYHSKILAMFYHHNEMIYEHFSGIPCKILHDAWCKQTQLMLLCRRAQVITIKRHGEACTVCQKNARKSSRFDGKTLQGFCSDNSLYNAGLQSKILVVVWFLELKYKIKLSLRQILCLYKK